MTRKLKKIKRKTEKSEDTVERSVEEKIKDAIVPTIREYLEQYEGHAISPSTAIEMTDFIMKLYDRTLVEYPEICPNWLLTYINLLTWGFSGAIVITPEK